MLNKESIIKIIAANRDDREMLDFVKGILDSFEQYHKAVFEEQLYGVIYNGAIDGNEFRENRTSLDRTRTSFHNALLANVRVLNRMADQIGAAPVYDGVVSEEKPYRRRVADAVFAYIEEVINNR